MHMTSKSLLLFLVLSVFGTPDAFATKQMVLKSVGAVGGKVITNRDVEANYIVDRVLYNNGSYTPISLGTEEFNSALDRLLVEYMVFEEATEFGVAKVADSEVDQSFGSVKTKLNNTGPIHSNWSLLGYSEPQLKEMVGRKLRSNRFIKYKSNSSYVQVSDEEARDYFNKNQLKFGTAEFEGFKVNIKKFLGKKNADDRLREWFEILRKKHKVKNLQIANEGHSVKAPADQ